MKHKSGRSERGNIGPGPENQARSNSGRGFNTPSCLRSRLNLVWVCLSVCLQRWNRQVLEVSGNTGNGTQAAGVMEEIEVGATLIRQRR